MYVCTWQGRPRALVQLQPFCTMSCVPKTVAPLEYCYSTTIPARVLLQYHNTRSSTVTVPQYPNHVNEQTLGFFTLQWYRQYVPILMRQSMLQMML